MGIYKVREKEKNEVMLTCSNSRDRPNLKYSLMIIIGSGNVGQIKATTNLWSIQISNNICRIYLPAQQRAILTSPVYLTQNFFSPSRLCLILIVQWICRCCIWLFLSFSFFLGKDCIWLFLAALPWRLEVLIVVYNNNID